LINNFRQLNELLDFESTKEDIELINREWQKLVKLEEDIKKAGKEEEKIRKSILETQQSLTKTTDKYHAKLDEIFDKSRRQLEDRENQQEVEERIVAIRRILNNYQERGTYLSRDESIQLREQFRQLRNLLNTHRDREAQLKREEKLLKDITDKFYSVRYRATRGFNRNPIEAKELELIAKGIEEKISQLGSKTGKEFHQALRTINEDMTFLNRRSQELRDNIREAENSFTGKFAHAMKTVPVWISAMTVFYGTMHQIQQGFQYLLDVDKAMTNLMKVTEATNEELEKFKETAIGISHDLGVLASDVINATAEFQKLGYTLQESAMLSKNTLLYANVGDMDLQKAQENIVSTIKGFNIEIDKTGQNVRRVVDMFNEVSNNFAISSEGIGEALKRSSAVLKEAGNTIEQSVGLVVSANSTIQDPMKVGTALKTISMRLRGVSEEGEQVVNLVPELEKTFSRISDKLGLTGKDRLTLMKDANTFKSTYEIFDQLAEVWKDLDDIERANLVELIGGKEQGAIVSSMINNWKDATESYKTALNSAGSAQREFNNYMESFEYKINRLKGALEEFWMTLLNDEGIKNLIDLLTSLIEKMTAFTELVGGNTVIMEFFGLLAVFGSKTLRDIVFGTATLTGVFKGLGTVFANIIGKIPRFLSLVGIIFAITKGAELLYNVLNRDEIERKKRLEGLEDEIAKIKEVSSEWEKTEGKRYIELANKSNRTPEEEREYLILQEKIKENMPDMIAYYDEQGRAVLKSADAMQKLIDKQKELLLKKEREEFDLKVEDENFEKLEKAVDKARETWNQILSSQDEKKMLNFSKKWIEENLRGIDESSPEFEAKVQELLDKLANKFEKSNIDTVTYTNIVDHIRSGLLNNKNINEVLIFLDAMINGIDEKTRRLNNKLDDAKNDVRINIDEFSMMLSEGFRIAVQEMGFEIDSNEFKFAQQLQLAIEDNLEKFNEDEIKDILNNIPEILKDSLKALKSEKIDLGKLFNVNEPSATYVADAINKVSKSAKLEKDELIALVHALELLKKQHIEVGNAMKGIQTGFLEEAISKANQFEDEISSLDSAYRQLADGQKLSISQVTDLIAKYPELTKYVENHNGTLRLTGEALKEVAKIREKEFKQDLEMSKQQAENAKKRAEVEIKSIIGIVKAEQILATARAKGLEQAMKTYEKEATSLIGQGDLQTAYGLLAKRDEIKETLSAYVDLTEEINGLNALLNTNYTENLGNIGNIDKDKKDAEEMIYITDEFKHTIEQLNYQIEKQKKLREDLVRHSAKYRKAIQNEIKLHQQKKEAIDEEIKSLERQIKTGKIEQKGMIRIDSTSSNYATGGSTKDIVWNFFKSKGFSDGAIAGIMGNLRVESNFNTTAYNRSSGATGIAQWLGGRLTNLKNYAKSVGQSWTDLNVQLEWIWKELNGADRTTKAILDKYGGLSKFMNMSAEESAKVFEKAFERSGGSLLGKRIKYANEFYKQYKGSGTVSTSDASKKEAERLQAIDNARSELIRLKEDALQIQEEIEQLRTEYIESFIEAYEKSAESIRNDIEKYELRAERANPYSKQLRKEINNQMLLINKEIRLKQRELKFWEDELRKNKELSETQKQILRDRIVELRKNVDLLRKENSEKAMEMIEAELGAYQLKYDREDSRLSYYRSMESRYETNTDDYRKSLTNQLIVLDEQRKIVQNEMMIIENHIKNNKYLTEAQKAELQNRFVDLKGYLQNVNDEIFNIEKRLKDSYEQIANEIIDIYKEMYQKQKELELQALEERLKALDEEMEAMEKAHDEKMKMYDDELKKWQEIINKQIEYIDRQESERDFNKEIEKLEKERQEIQKKINELSLDDSYEAKAKVAELRKQLAEKEEEINERRHDREIELRKQNLQDFLESKEKEIEELKENWEWEVEENGRKERLKYEQAREYYEKKKELLEEERKAIEKKWENEINNERFFNQLREDILNGHLSNIKKNLSSFIDFVKDNMSTIGESISNNLIDKIQEANKVLNDIKSGGYKSDIPQYKSPEKYTPPKNNTGNNTGNNSNNNNSNNNKKQGFIGYAHVTEGQVKVFELKDGKMIPAYDVPKGNQLRVWAIDEKPAIDNNGNLALKNGKPYMIKWYSIGGGRWIREDSERIKYVSLNTGGYTGDQEGFAFLHKKELVLNAEQTKHILDTARIVEKLKNIIPKLNINLPTIAQPVGASGDLETTITNEFNINVNIENLNGDRRSADIVAEQIMNKIKRTKGGRF
jgi:TP901 family phage tail tape measure protein